MKTVQTLIDKASKACGSDAALARRMGIYPADISNLRAGKRALSPELAAEIADIAGEDARQAVIDAVIERNLTGKKGPLLKEILGKEIAAGEAAALGFSYKNALTYATETIAIVRNPYNVSIHRIYSMLAKASSVIKSKVYKTCDTVRVIHAQGFALVTSGRPFGLNLTEHMGGATHPPCPRLKSA